MCPPRPLAGYAALCVRVSRGWRVEDHLRPAYRPMNWGLCSTYLHVTEHWIKMAGECDWQRNGHAHQPPQAKHTCRKPAKSELLSCRVNAPAPAFLPFTAVLLADRPHSNPLPWLLCGFTEFPRSLPPPLDGHPPF